MSTHSMIGYMDGDICRAVYCHWDGHVITNGRILLNNYDLEKTKKLVELGGISSLGPEIGTKHSFDSRNEGETTFYTRDRGDKHTVYEFSSLAEMMDEDMGEYYYILEDGTWYVADAYGDDAGNLVPVSTALERELQRED